MLSVSNYHYIREDFTNKYPSIFGVTPQVFEKQLLLLKNEGDFIKTSDLKVNYNEILYSKDNYFLITFDDGLKEQYNYALPILDKLGIDAFFFVNSINSEKKIISIVHKIHLLRSSLSPKQFLNHLFNFKEINVLNSEKKTMHECYRFDDKKSAELKYILNFKMEFIERELFINNLFKLYFDDEEIFKSLYMSEKELIDMADRGYLGSHSHSHLPLGLLSQNDIKYELQHSKRYLEDLTDTPIDVISYPYGTAEACTENVTNIAKEIGYKIGFTTKIGSNKGLNNLLSLNRFDCNDLPGGKNYKVKAYGV